MRKKTVSFISVGMLLFLFMFGQEVSANSSNNGDPIENITLSSKKIDKDTIETKIISKEKLENPGMMNSLEEEVTTLQIDFSEADFFDEAGKIVDKEKVLKTIVPIDNDPSISGDFTTMGSSTSGGAYSSGSGYTVVKGLRVSGWSGVARSALEINYSADFTRVQGGYDRLDRIYNNVNNYLGSFSVTSQGVFRKQETISYSAYGGIKGEWTVSGIPIVGGGGGTKYIYIRVGNDRFWLDTNL